VSLKERITELVTPLLEEDLFLVEVLAQMKREIPRLLIIIDGDTGVNIDRCADISRKLAALMEAHQLMDGAFVLDVSSPGVDYPLKLVRQYHSNKGRNLKVELSDGSLQFGKLEEVTDEGITLSPVVKKGKKPLSKAQAEAAKTTFYIAFTDIAKATVEVTFG
jgi:ribosome maturation factor RimP